MEDRQHDPAKLKKAIKRLTRIKGFYSHLVVYLIINLLGLTLFIIYRVLNKDKFAELDAGLRNWVDWNIILIPILWGIGLFVHWLYAHYKKPRFLREWEERQMKKYMEE